MKPQQFQDSFQFIIYQSLFHLVLYRLQYKQHFEITHIETKFSWIVDGFIVLVDSWVFWDVVPWCQLVNMYWHLKDVVFSKKCNTLWTAWPWRCSFKLSVTVICQHRVISQSTLTICNTAERTSDHTDITVNHLLVCAVVLWCHCWCPDCKVTFVCKVASVHFTCSCKFWISVSTGPDVQKNKFLSVCSVPS